MEISTVGLSPRPGFDDIMAARELRVRDVCGAKFRFGLFNGSLIALSLWGALFLLVR